jgi:hypothetical protein
MMEEFVIGFMYDDPDGLTPIDIVIDVTGLTYEEVKSCCEIVTVEERSPT